MPFHLIFALWGFAAPFALWQMTGKTPYRKGAATAVGAMSGLACGAGLAVGGFFQETTANIHSGYSFASMGTWLELAFLGGVPGLVVGVTLARLARRWRPAVAVFLLLAAVATGGWIISAARPSIDCDVRDDFCAERYG